MSAEFRPLFVFAADTHLQPCAWVKHPGLAGDAYCSFAQIVAYCCEHALNLVLGGDIFDKHRPDPDSVQFLLQQAEQLRARDQVILFVQGDHDYQATMPWSAVGRHAVSLNRMTCAAGPFQVYGLDWASRDRLAASLATVPANTDILVMHEAWEELQRIGQTEGRIADIPHAKVLLTGDYHVAMQTEVQTADGRCIRVYSPGSTCMQAVDEQPDKSFLLVGECAGEVSVQRIPLLTRRRLVLNYQTEAQLDMDLQNHVLDHWLASQPALPPEISKPILRVTFNDEIPHAWTRISTAAAERFHLFPNPVRVPAATVVVADQQHGDSGAFSTLADACRRLAQDPADYAAVMRLTRNPSDTKRELEVMYAEFKSAFMAGSTAAGSPGAGE